MDTPPDTHKNADKNTDKGADKGASVLGVSKSASNRHWLMRAGDDRHAMAMAQRFDLPDSVCRILANRNVALDEVETYLDPKLKNLLPDPSVLTDMDKACDRLVTALDNNEKIAVFGDYDVDGATSSALLKRYFAALGNEMRVYIPDRMREGYGPNSAAFETLAGEGVSLIITVDCGTMAHEALNTAQKLNVDVIVADHHQTGTDLPPCYALVNPRREDDMSGLGFLAAVGVTFMILVGLSRKLRKSGYFENKTEPDLMSLLDIVALGTVCDVVPLEGVNRAFVAQGLKVMARRKNIGLRTLADISRMTSAPAVFDCGFKLGPRINAGGRVGDSELGVRLLATTDPDEAAGLALRMDELNTERRAIGDKAQALAEMKVEELLKTRNGLPPALLVSDKSFHAGVIGIVAGRLKDQYRRPSFVLAIDEDGTAKGSARSIAGIDIGKLVAQAVRENIIAGGGGHAMAAGVTLENAQQLHDFEAFLEKQLGTMSFAGASDLTIDGVISTTGASRDFYDQLQQAGPFGAGSPEPRFVIPAARIVHADIVGENHVRCRLSSDGGKNLKAMAFASVNEDVRTLLMQARFPLHIVGYLRADDWQERHDVQFMIQDAARA